MEKYKEFNRLAKFIWNKVDYKLFKESILAAVERDCEGFIEEYIEEKWNANKNNLINFYAFFDEKAYNFIYNKMLEMDYYA